MLYRMANMRSISMKKTFTFRELLITIIVLTLILTLSAIILKRIKSRSLLYICRSNLKDIGRALQQYTNDYEGQYPTSSKWCDLLIENTGVEKTKFLCRSVGDATYSSYVPIDANDFSAKVISLGDYNDYRPPYRKRYVYKIEWSHYAINPNAKPNSPPDIVLLFETEHGWNQAGGPELISIKNHLESEGVEGCQVLFNDGSVEFVKTKDLTKLKWNDTNNEKVGNNP